MKKIEKILEACIEFNDLVKIAIKPSVPRPRFKSPSWRNVPTSPTTTRGIGSRPGKAPKTQRGTGTSSKSKPAPKSEPKTLALDSMEPTKPYAKDFSPDTSISPSSGAPKTTVDFDPVASTMLEPTVPFQEPYDLGKGLDGSSPPQVIEISRTRGTAASKGGMNEPSSLDPDSSSAPTRRLPGTPPGNSKPKLLSRLKISPELIKKYTPSAMSALQTIGLITVAVAVFSGEKPKTSDDEKLEIIEDAIKNNKINLPNAKKVASSLESLLYTAENISDQLEYYDVFAENTKTMISMLNQIGNMKVNLDNKDQSITFLNKIKNELSPSLKEYISTLQEAQSLTSDPELLEKLDETINLFNKYSAFLSSLS